MAQFISFCERDEVRSLLKKFDLARGVKGDFLKYNSKRLYEAAREFVQLGDLQWKQLNKK
jgi:hypothetical protein